jgi:hypothetical protein
MSSLVLSAGLSITSIYLLSYPDIIISARRLPEAHPPSSKKPDYPMDILEPQDPVVHLKTCRGVAKHKTPPPISRSIRSPADSQCSFLFFSFKPGTSSSYFFSLPTLFLTFKPSRHPFLVPCVWILAPFSTFLAILLLVVSIDVFESATATITTTRRPVDRGIVRAVVRSSPRDGLPKWGRRENRETTEKGTGNRAGLSAGTTNERDFRLEPKQSNQHQANLPRTSADTRKK